MPPKYHFIFISLVGFIPGFYQLRVLFRGGQQRVNRDLAANKGLKKKLKRDCHIWVIFRLKFVLILLINEMITKVLLDDSSKFP